MLFNEPAPSTTKSLQRLTASEALHAPLDRRVHLRGVRTDRLFVQTRAAEAHARRTLKCVTADVSRGGLQLAVDEYLAKGEIVELWLNLTGAKRNYYLLGTVRWCRAEDAGFRLGIRLQDAPGTDLKAWRKLCFL